MALRYSNSNSLGNGLTEIEFFSKDIDYDKQFYESLCLEKDKHKENNGISRLRPKKPIKHKDLVKMWEEGGPVKVLPMPNFDVYPLYFTNFQELDYYKLKKLLGNFFTLCEFDNLKFRVTYKTEDDLRIAYKELKKDDRYNLIIFVDAGDYFVNHKGYFKGDTYEPPKNKTSPRLIDQWINNGDVVIDSYRNCYPIQIKNYKQFNHDELVEFFSKYGKFTSIAQLENEYVQVKFCTEETARICVTDLKKDRNYNVRLLFFLKELNKDKKLVKDIVPSKSEGHVMKLLNAEERIKFDPDQIPVNRQPSRANRKKKKQEEEKTESCKNDANMIYFRKNCENGNVYVRGTPLENPFLIPPDSYKVWKNKKNNMPTAHMENLNCTNKDASHEYYNKIMKDLGSNSHSFYCNGARY